jgi:hypothetical protein
MRNDTSSREAPRIVRPWDRIQHGLGDAAARGELRPDHAALRAGVQHGPPIDTVDRERHHQAVTPHRDPLDRGVGHRPGRSRVGTGAGAIDRQAARRQIDVEVERQQDIGAQQPVRLDAAELGQRKRADPDARYRQRKAPTAKSSSTAS